MQYCWPILLFPTITTTRWRWPSCIFGKTRPDIIITNTTATGIITTVLKAAS